MNSSTFGFTASTAQTFHPDFITRAITLAPFDPEGYGASSAQSALRQRKIDLVDLMGSTDIGREHKILITQIHAALCWEAVA